MVWLTLDQSTANLTDQTVKIIKRVCHAASEFCLNTMDPVDVGGLDLKVVKLDTTIDLVGAFLPPNDGSAKTLIKFKLEALIKEMVNGGKFKFFCDRTINEPKVTEADGNLSTCIKFDVMD